ncbi:AMP-binding protein [Algoriphagus sp.]|uniref:AMP-binding protein n=1 Tax=Algoriphagus sp. TaxID=1872435 RepID=UPI00391A0666
MFQLHYNDQIFQTKEDFEGMDLELPAFAKAAFSFCEAWLSDKTYFSQQTSGSTGTPKTIEISREQMMESAKATGSFFKTNSNTKLLCCLNPEYIAGKMMLVRAMVWDCPIWLVEPHSNPFLDLPEVFLPDFVALVPLQVEEILNNPKTSPALKKVSNLIIGGAPISEGLKSRLIANGIPAWQTYGMTETVSHVALARIEEGETTYQTLAGVEIGQDERGAVWTKSLMSGQERIQTNDLVELKSSTSFIWLGRADFVINSGGLKLHSELLEKKSEALIAEFFPGCRYFFLGEKDEKLGERLVLLIEKTEPNEELAKLLQEKMRNVFGKFETPKKIYFIPSFVHTESGKINRDLTFKQLQI